jgi:hypothetical protein
LVTDNLISQAGPIEVGTDENIAQPKNENIPIPNRKLKKSTEKKQLKRREDR